MDTTNWKWYSVQELFHPQKCKCSNATELLTPGNDIAYIGAKKSDNGVMAYVERVDTLVTEGNCIVFIGDGQGSVGYCLYQPVEFIGSTTLLAGYNENLNQYNAQFLIGILDCERYRYSFGRKYNKQAIEKTSILLPAKDNGTPDWQYMEDYVKNTLIPQLPEQARAVWMQTYDTHPEVSNPLMLDLQNWKPFRYDEIFDIKHGFYNKKPDDNPQGNIPFIGATDSNNGVTSYTDMETIEVTTKTGDGKNAPIEDKVFSNCIAVTNNGSVGYAYYQDKPFTCTHDVNPLYLKDHELNKYIALFLCTIIEQERFRWAYGRKWRPTRMPSSIIKLPVTKDGTPDWKFMEDYIKSLPYSKNI